MTALTLRARRLCALLEEATESGLPEPISSDVTRHGIRVQLDDSADFAAWTLWLGAGVQNIEHAGRIQHSGTTTRDAEPIELSAVGPGAQRLDPTRWGVPLNVRSV